MLTELEINKKVKELMNQMTLKEKIGQLYETIYEGSAITGPEFDNSRTNKLLEHGLVGSILGLYDNQMIYNLQKNAVEKTRLHIPLFFANDIIHGCRTIFPINLAMSTSWNIKLIEKACNIAGYESSHSGVHVVFSPMVDLVRDPRFGRVMESNGEDPYLSSEITKAYVKGYQRNHISNPNSVASCVKHFAGYGAALAGRDYNSVDMSKDTFLQYYLPPFASAKEANVQMFMTSFNTLNGVPSTCNKYLLTDILRKKLKFKHVTISDYTATEELIKHKVAKNKYDCAKKSLEAGLDHEMVSTCYLDEIENIINDDPKYLDYVNNAVARVLSLKYRLGLFDNPYKNIYLDFEKYWLEKPSLEVALKIAQESITLLENDGILPLNKKEKIAYIGPFIDEKRVNGAWGGKVNYNDTVTIYESLKNNKINFEYAKGSNIFDSLNIEEVIKKTENVDKIVLTIGEEQWMSGENKSRAYLNVPKIQDELLDELIKLNKKIILIIHAGRPLILTKYKKYFEEGKINAILYAWFLGTKSGDAIVNTLYGKNNPSSKLTMTFPYAVGQIPIYYNSLNTGRPIENDKSIEYLTRYIDIPNEPLYPFGYGKSYANFIYKDLIVLNQTVNKNEPLKFKVTITNDSKYSGYEIIQSYIECLYSSVSRPLKELKAFKKVYFKANETKVIDFEIKYNDLKYYINEKEIVENGQYRVYVGTNSKDTLAKTFNVETSNVLPSIKK